MLKRKIADCAAWVLGWADPDQSPSSYRAEIRLLRSDIDGSRLRRVEAELQRDSARRLVKKRDEEIRMMKRGGEDGPEPVPAKAD